MSCVTAPLQGQCTVQPLTCGLKSSHQNIAASVRVVGRPHAADPCTVASTGAAREASPAAAPREEEGGGNGTGRGGEVTIGGAGVGLMAELLLLKFSAQ